MRYPGDGLTLALIGLPTLLAAVFGWTGPATAGEWLAYGGRLTAVAGLACLLVAAIMSVRVPGFDRHFGGLTRLWKQHHYLGLAALLLLMAHPLMMALSRLPFGLEAMQEVVLPPTRDWAMWAGWLALLAMMIFLAPSFRFFGQPDYQRWKVIHFLAGLAIVAALIHTLPLTRTLPGGLGTLVWGALGGLAVLVFLWRALLARRLLRKPYRVTRVHSPAERIVEIGLQAVGENRLAHQAGQFIYFTPHDPNLAAGINEEHPYTLCSSPTEDTLRIAVKDLGDASGALLELREGSRASVEGPYGLFFPPRLRQQPQLWIGGGIGITPFVSAAGAMAAGEDWGDVVLINCANDPGRAYYLDALEDAANDCHRLKIIPHYFEEQGPLNLEFIRQHCPDAHARQWFVCGPTPLVQISRRIARNLSLPASSFHSEEFSFL